MKSEPQNTKNSSNEIKHQSHLNSVIKDQRKRYKWSPGSSKPPQVTCIGGAQFAYFEHRAKPSFSFQALVPWFHFPLEQAARHMEKSATKLKQICRSAGVKQWPYRKLSKVKNQIQDIDHCIKSSFADTSTLEFQKLKQEKSILNQRVFDIIQNAVNFKLTTKDIQLVEKHLVNESNEGKDNLVQLQESGNELHELFTQENRKNVKPEKIPEEKIQYQLNFNNPIIGSSSTESLNNNNNNNNNNFEKNTNNNNNSFNNNKKTIFQEYKVDKNNNNNNNSTEINNNKNNNFTCHTNDITNNRNNNYHNDKSIITNSNSWVNDFQKQRKTQVRENSEELISTSPTINVSSEPKTTKTKTTKEFSTPNLPTPSSSLRSVICGFPDSNSLNTQEFHNNNNNNNNNNNHYNYYNTNQNCNNNITNNTNDFNTINNQAHKNNFIQFHPINDFNNNQNKINVNQNINSYNNMSPNYYQNSPLQRFNPTSETRKNVQQTSNFPKTMSQRTSEIDLKRSLNVPNSDLNFTRFEIKNRNTSSPFFPSAKFNQVKQQTENELSEKYKKPTSKNPNTNTSETISISSLLN